MSKEILKVKDLTVQYKIDNKNYFNAVNNISFDVYEGEVVGLVGESGSGKSSTAKAIMGINEHSGGYVKLSGDFVPSDPKDIKGSVNRWLASKVQMIFQDAKSSLNPRETVLEAVSEGAKNQKLHKKALGFDFIEDNLKFIKSYKFKKSLEYKETLLEWELKKVIELNKMEFNKNLKDINTKVNDSKLILKSLKQTQKTKIRTLKTTFYQAQNIERNDSRKESLESRIKKIRDYFKIKISKAEIQYKELKDSKKAQINNIKNDLDKKNKKDQAANDDKKIKIKELSSEEGVKFIEEFNNFQKTESNKLSYKSFYRDLVEKTLKEVSISPDNINKYPGEFSGGQAQRIAIARTLIMKSDLIVADEPISALDVSIQAQVVNILKELIKKNNLTVLFIAHDLQMVKYISDRIIVMYKGSLVEQGPSDEVYSNPKHPYTKSLINAVPSIDHPERIHKAKEYKPEQIISFDNSESIDLEWHDVNKKGHKVFGTKEQFKEWIK